jgi:hypothetical protein
MSHIALRSPASRVACIYSVCSCKFVQGETLKTDWMRVCNAWQIKSVFITQPLPSAVPLASRLDSPPLTHAAISTHHVRDTALRGSADQPLAAQITSAGASGAQSRQTIDIGTALQINTSGVESKSTSPAKSVAQSASALHTYNLPSSSHMAPAEKTYAAAHGAYLCVLVRVHVMHV